VRKMAESECGGIGVYSYSWEESEMARYSDFEGARYKYAYGYMRSEMEES